MISYSSNISVLVKANVANLKELQLNPDQVLRSVALAVLPVMKKRVHIDGLDASGAQIGTYTPEYMKVRTGNFKNADKFSRGDNKGENKNAGRYTNAVLRKDKKTGETVGQQKVGTPRPKYNRSDDTKVVGSLTRKMENDMSVVAAGKGYGIGYLNPFNFQKAEWLDETYDKPILTQLTTSEFQLAVDVANAETAKILNQQ